MTMADHQSIVGDFTQAVLCSLCTLVTANHLKRCEVQLINIHVTKILSTYKIGIIVRVYNN